MMTTFVGLSCAIMIYHVSLLTILDRTTNCDQMSLSRASAPDSLSIFELLVTSPIIPSARIGLHVGGLHLAGHPVHSGEPRPSVVAGGRSSWFFLNRFWSETRTTDFKGLIDGNLFIHRSACFPDLAPGPCQTLALLRCLSKWMPSIGRVYILTRWFLEVKSHSSSSDLNELSLGLRMDVIGVVRDPFPSSQPCQLMGSFQASC